MSPRGFSIIELVIVLAIAAIILTLAVPNFQQWIANSKVRTTAEALQNDLRLAQATAMTQGRQTILVLTNNPAVGINVAPVAAGAPASYWYVQRTPNTLDVAQGNPTALPILISSSPIGQTTGVTITTVPLLGGVTVNAVCFNSLGRQVAASVALGSTVPANAACVPQAVQFNIAPPTGGNRPLAVQVSAAGTVRSCDPNVSQTAQPFGC
ncbi:MAG: GspH/FimT family pseudopilin [Burkholderiaceae bacterium]|jgi:type IV fimbrial biogenesis protein FimT